MEYSAVPLLDTLLLYKYLINLQPKDVKSLFCYLLSTVIN